MFYIGFTGSRKGLIQIQEIKLRNLLESYNYMIRDDVTIRHGDCIGADEKCHDIAKHFGFEIIVHLPDISSMRAYTQETDIEPKPYIARNKDIVDNSNILIVCPNTIQEQLRSVTWSTYRYAKKKGVTIVLILPTGEVETIHKNVKK